MRTITRLFFIVAMLFPMIAMAQTATITGTVEDETGEPLMGVTVLVKGTNNGASTDLDGNFSIKAAVGSTLTFNYIGYQPAELPATAQPMKVVLHEDSQVLDEVVVTAMGIQRKDASLTYATQQVKSEDLMKVSDANFVTALNGKVSGVTISQSAGGAGGSSKILLRGNKSVTGNNAPLIVVDGIPMTNQVGGAASSYSSNWDPTYGTSAEGGDALSLINPDDIESINVLKGANAAALYGSAAANGVLMITTKKGKEGKVSVTVNSGITFDRAFLTPKLQSVYGNVVDPVAGTMSQDSWGPKLSDYTTEMLGFQGAKLTNRAQDKEDFFKTGISLNNSVALSGGTEKVTTYFSYSNSNVKGIIPENRYNRNTFAFRQGYKLFDNKLKIDVAINYIYAKTTNRGGGGTFMNPLFDLYLAGPNIDLDYYKSHYSNPNGSWESNSHTYHVNGQRVSGTTTLNGLQQVWAYSGAKKNNPYWLTKVNRSENTEERVFGYATANYEIIPGLNVQARVNVDRTKYHGIGKRYATTQNAASMEDYGVFNQDNMTSNDWYVDALVSYNKNFNKDWDVSATAGWSGHTVEGTSQNIYGTATYYRNGMEKLPTLVNHFEPTITWDSNPTSYSKSSNWDKGLFVTGQIGWKDMVFLEGSYRQDWYRAFKQFSDRGTPDNYGYWSMGGNTLVHKYVPMPDFITYLKVRASYAEVGNSIPNVFYSLGSVNLGTGVSTGSGYGYFSNPKPEKSKSIEAGWDISFFNSALMWDITYYHTELENSYFIAPSSSGKATPVNTGLIRNQGFETTLTYNVIALRDWMWKTGFNFSYNHNRIVKTYKNKQGNPARMEQNIANNKILVRYEEGGTYGDMYAYDFRRNDDGTLYISKNTGTPQLSPRDLVYLGNMNSKFQLGWSNTITWKDLSLYFLINGRIGGKCISLTESYLDYFGVSERTAAARLNAERNNIVWTSADGTVNKPGMYIGEQIVPIDEYYKFVGGSQVASEYVYDATNFRMAELSVGYTIRNLFKGAIKSINISAVGRNLFFIYKDSPIDPEISLSTKNGMGGVDVFNIPSTRSYGINLKIEF